VSESHPLPNVAPGSVVVVRDAEWLVLSTEATASGLLITVQGLSELVRDTTATFYSDIDDIEVLDPAAARVVGDDSSGYRRAKLWLEATLRKTPVPLHDTTLGVSTQMLADPLEYQREAVRKALDPANLRPRILIADAVGLGKTIEIGMILAELVRRGRGERILVVTPKHVLEQMQQEMWTKFALPFVRLDSVGIQRVRQKLPATRNPFSFFKRAIISVDTLKQDRYRSHLAKQRWDAVVIDESHNVMNNATLNGQLARILAPNTEALILASATPHNGQKESFAELIRMLEPTAVTPSGEIIKSELDRLVIRRHRHSATVAKEVGSDWAERQEPNNVLVAASPAENAIADELAHVWLHPHPGSSNPYSGENSSLFPWTLAKAFLSSPKALEESLTERLKRVRRGESSPAREREIEALERLLTLTVTALDARSAKYEALLAHARGIGVGPSSDDRLVVFSERVATLHWLRTKLRHDLKLREDQIAIMHGGLTDEEQQGLVDSFKQSSSPIRILVTGDVASEGVNLHSQCHELVHFDIPWSLIRIEQRNGRIDRYGQKHAPRITTLLLDPSNDRFAGDVRVLKNLLERENEAHGALGDVASLMGKYSASAEEDAIRDVLRGKQTLEETVRTADSLLHDDSNSLEALFAQMDAAPAATATGTTATTTGSTAAVASRASTSGTGLFPDHVTFLDTALDERSEVPTDPPERGGVSWKRSTGIAQLVPPRDLKQRLDVLPQSYLRDRKVTDNLVLATTTPQAKQSADDAINNKAQYSTWPEAHYLGPLHPVLEWASDHALSRLGRNTVFAVRGDVESPMVLVHATLTNRRGQVVASSYCTVEFPTPSLHAVQSHPDARAALTAMGFSASVTTNPGRVATTDLQRLIPLAVDATRATAEQLLAASGADIQNRIGAWAERATEWQTSAAGQTQLPGLTRHRITVEKELQMAEEMSPNQHFVRPLLVVVPAHEPVDTALLNENEV
jgi:superfamily II DNA or RNA helicase